MTSLLFHLFLWYAKAKRARGHERPEAFADDRFRCGSRIDALRHFKSRIGIGLIFEFPKTCFN